MLFHRYSQPMVILDRMIQGKRLAEFIREFVNIRNEETEETSQWEFWLHKVFDMTYAEFKSAISPNNTNGVAPPEEELKQTVMASREMLDCFTP